MCNPVLVVMAASVAVSAYSQKQQGDAASSASKAQQAEYRMQANAVEVRTMRDQRLRDDEFRQLEAKNNAAAAFSGFARESFDHVFDANQRRAQDDLRQIGNQGAGEASANIRAGNTARDAGRQARYAGMVGAASTIIGGVASAYTNGFIGGGGKSSLVSFTRNSNRAY